MNFYEKIVKLQSDLKAPKNQYNNFGKYNYRSCEDIVEGVKPLTKEFGLILLVSDELVLIGERYYIKATAILTDGENKIETVGYARESDNKKGMDSSQLTGSTSSYARKYALNGLLAIDDTKDADGANKHGKDDEKPKNDTSDKKATSKSYASKKQIELIESLILKFSKSVKTKQALLDKYKLENINKLSKSQASEAIKTMLDKLDKIQEENKGDK